VRGRDGQGEQVWRGLGCFNFVRAVPADGVGPGAGGPGGGCWPPSSLCVGVLRGGRGVMRFRIRCALGVWGGGVGVGWDCLGGGRRPRGGPTTHPPPRRSPAPLGSVCVFGEGVLGWGW